MTIVIVRDHEHFGEEKSVHSLFGQSNLGIL